MALRLTAPDRRSVPRWAPEQVGLKRDGLLRPGQSVELVNVSSRGALVWSAGRMLPGGRTELHLWRVTGRHVVPGTILRCRVARLEPLQYEGALAFDEPWMGERHG